MCKDMPWNLMLKSEMTTCEIHGGYSGAGEGSPKIFFHFPCYRHSTTAIALTRQHIITSSVSCIWGFAYNPTWAGVQAEEVI
jgi:hypothetical protein